MRRTLAAVFFLALLGAVLAGSTVLQAVDARILDAQFRFLRTAFPQPVARDVVIVGIDPLAVKRLQEPIALWHRHLGKFFTALAQARAAAIGVDVILPDRSADAILPGYDAALMRGIVAARKDSALVLGLTVDTAGVPHQIHKPLLAVAGAESTGYVIWRADPDGVVRRFSEGLTPDGKPVPTLSGQMARRLGVQPSPGLVDFWRGEPFSYVPLTNVLDWYDNGNVAELEKHFAGKPVFLGVILPFEDRVPMPVPLWADEPDSRANPGVMVHAQALRSMLGKGLIKPAPMWLIAALAAVPALLWLLSFGAWATFAALAAIALVVVAASTALLAQGWYAPTAAIVFASAAAVSGRLLYETGLRIRDHARLRNAFAGSVSPHVLAEITAGRLSPSFSGARTRIAVVFVDVRDFTARSEALPPETVIALLNRYFEVVIDATHKHDGTIDKFLGDGIMAYFGAPQRIAKPAAAAVAAAREILSAMGRLNAQLRTENTQPIEISIGIHTGEAVVGHIGSKERYEYTAIGDVVNVASRLESLTKEVGYALVCTRDVIAHLENSDAFVPLGARAIRGHSPVELYGFERRRAPRAPGAAPDTATTAAEQPRA